MKNRARIEASIAELESSAVTDASRYEDGTYEHIADVAVPSAQQALLLGAGYLAPGECSLAKEWFGDGAPGWAWKFATGVEMALDKETSISGVTWRNAQRAIKTAALSGFEDLLSETLADVEAVIETIPAGQRGDENCYPVGG